MRGIERDGLADDLLVLGVLLVAQHVHEGAVVDAVHAQRAHEVALHQPERLGQQERVGRLGGDAVDDLAPELDGHAALELVGGQGRGATRGDAASPGPGSGYQSRWMWRFARTMAASKRMTGKRRATSRICPMTASRTSARR